MSLIDVKRQFYIHKAFPASVTMGIETILAQYFWGRAVTRSLLLSLMNGVKCNI